MTICYNFNQFNDFFSSPFGFMDAVYFSVQSLVLTRPFEIEKRSFFMSFLAL